MSAFTSAIASFIGTVKDPRAWVEELNDHSKKLAAVYSQATPSELDDSLAELARLIPGVRLVALGQVAITCGSLVEHGGNPEIAGTSLLGQLGHVNEISADFYRRCRALAEADTELVEELRTEVAENAGDEIDPGSLTAGEIVEDHVDGQGWQTLAQRLGQALFKDSPDSVLGYMAGGFFRLGLIAHLSRSRSLRETARTQSSLLEQTLIADQTASTHRSFLAIMLRVLDDEPILVLHVEQHKGFEIRISGIADNFQLHTLLADAIIGSPIDGMVAGEAPSKRAAAEFRDSSPGPEGGDNVTGAFDLLNWSAMQPNGTLDTQGSEHWIWNEGCPADIAQLDGRRIVLLGPTSYARHWRAGRIFSGMVGELTVERHLSDSEVGAWIGRLAREA